MSFELQETTIHGHRVAYRLAGSGPPIVLIHGITSSSVVWELVGPQLARHHTVVAPDLLGHGQSAKPRGDYSMGAFASGIRDLVLWLGLGPVTIVGHSLGGGVAMQFAYQFPERTERLALVSSGGLGRSVHGLLRAATLPGSELVLPLLAGRQVLNAGRTAGRALGRVGIQLGNDAVEIARGHASLGDPESRAAFVHTLRASIDVGGQRVQALDRLYLAEASAAADRVGGARPDHPSGPRAPRPQAGKRQSVRAVRGRRPLPLPRRAGAVRGHARGLDRDHRAESARRGPLRDAVRRHAARSRGNWVRSRGDDFLAGRRSLRGWRHRRHARSRSRSGPDRAGGPARAV